jgi:serine/threonine protein kinase
MLKKTGHGKSVDWYLLGVLFYEMLVGIPPYFTNSKYTKHKEGNKYLGILRRESYIFQR